MYTKNASLTTKACFAVSSTKGQEMCIIHEVVVTASGDKTAREWDAATGKALSEPTKHDGAVYSAQFSADGQWVVTASEDKTARVWDIPTITRKDSVDDANLLADLAEATGGLALKAFGQTEGSGN